MIARACWNYLNRLVLWRTAQLLSDTIWMTPVNYCARLHPLWVSATPAAGSELSIV